MGQLDYVCIISAAGSAELLYSYFIENAESQGSPLSFVSQNTIEQENRTVESWSLNSGLWGISFLEAVWFHG